MERHSSTQWVFDVSPLSSADLVMALEAKHINLRALDPKLVYASFDETHYPEDVHAINAALKEAGVKGTATPAQLVVNGKVPEAFARTKPSCSTSSTPYIQRLK